MEETLFDSKRRLCPDGACVGVLGADGRCSVCRRLAGEAAAAADDDGPDDEPISTSASASPAPASAAPAAASSAAGFDPKRRLCDDGSCVGIVGADGICGTCGRKAD